MDQPLFQPIVGCSPNTVYETRKIVILPSFNEQKIYATNATILVDDVVVGDGYILKSGQQVSLRITSSSTVGATVFSKVVIGTDVSYVAVLNRNSQYLVPNKLYDGLPSFYRMDEAGLEYIGVNEVVRKVGNVETPLSLSPISTNVAPTADSLNAADPATKMFYRINEAGTILSSASTSGIPVAVLNVVDLYSGGTGTSYDTWVINRNGIIDVFNSLGNKYTSINVGGTPIDVVSTSDGSIIYIAFEDGTITQLLKSGTSFVSSSFSCPNVTALAIAYNDNSIYAATSTGYIHKISGTTYTSLSVGGIFTCGASDDDRVWFCNQTTKKIYSILQATLAISTSVACPDTPNIISCDTTTGYLLIIPIWSNTIYSYNGTEFTPIVYSDIVYDACIVGSTTYVSYYAHDAEPKASYPVYYVPTWGASSTTVSPNAVASTVEQTISEIESSILVQIPTDINGHINVNGVNSGYSATVQPSNTVSISFTTPNDDYATNVFPISGGSLVEYFQVSTGKYESSLTPFVLDDKTGISESVIQSNSITLSGISSTLTASADNAILYKNGVAVIGSTTVVNGDVIYLARTLGYAGTTSVSSITVGSYTTVWGTGAAGVNNTNPPTLLKHTFIDTEVNTVFQYTWTIDSANAAYWYSIEGQTILRNGVEVVSGTNFLEGDSLTLRVTSSKMYNERYSFNVNCGSYVYCIDITTEHNRIPEYINLGTYINARPNEEITSIEGYIDGLTSDTDNIIYTKDSYLSILVNNIDVGTYAYVKNGDVIKVLFKVHYYNGPLTFDVSVYAKLDSGFEKAFAVYTVIPIQLNGGVYQHYCLDQEHTQNTALKLSYSSHISSILHSTYYSSASSNYDSDYTFNSFADVYGDSYSLVHDYDKSSIVKQYDPTVLLSGESFVTMYEVYNTQWKTAAYEMLSVLYNNQTTSLFINRTSVYPSIEENNAWKFVKTEVFEYVQTYKFSKDHVKESYTSVQTYYVDKFNVEHLAYVVFVDAAEFWQFNTNRFNKQSVYEVLSKVGFTKEHTYVYEDQHYSHAYAFAKDFSGIFIKNIPYATIDIESTSDIVPPTPEYTPQTNLIYLYKTSEFAASSYSVIESTLPIFYRNTLSVFDSIQPINDYSNFSIVGSRDAYIDKDLYYKPLSVDYYGGFTTKALAQEYIELNGIDGVILNIGYWTYTQNVSANLVCNIATDVELSPSGKRVPVAWLLHGG